MGILKPKSAIKSMNTPTANEEDGTVQDDIDIDADKDRQPGHSDEMEDIEVQGDEQMEMDPRPKLNNNGPSMEDSPVPFYQVHLVSLVHLFMYSQLLSETGHPGSIMSTAFSPTVSTIFPQVQGQDPITRWVQFICKTFSIHTTHQFTLVGQHGQW